MGQHLSTRAAAGGRRRWAGAGISLSLHALVLAVLGWTVAPKLPSRPDGSEPPAVQLQLVRRASSPAKASFARETARPSAVRRPEPQTTRSVIPRPLLTPSPLPAAPGPSSASAPSAAGAGTGGTGVHPGPMPSGEPGADLRGFLRATVGCSHADYMRLTTAERERCDKGFGEAARTAPHFDPIPPEKRGAYFAAAEAAEKRRAMRDDVFYKPVTSAGTLPPDAIHSVRIK